MSYNNYKKIDEVLREFDISYAEHNFVQMSEIQVSEYFESEIELTLSEGLYKSSESAIGETLIYPVLREIWKLYKKDLQLWSHQPLHYDDNYFVVPDYLIARRSHMGNIFLDKPSLIITGVKHENFEEAWIDCISDMMAARRSNRISTHESTFAPIFGIVSNGVIWEFGILDTSYFIKEATIYTIQNLKLLLSAIGYMFEQSKLVVSLS
ncbi:MAG: hypothetical protein DCF19_10520 [Pseudanabaena frigida]|uniref:Uncharacterized protein n=1 Tax=Pseudanabaena frigida TaxID=945775 RepID=A0A2W4WGU8_9CYAN|nr:MAG: hypothetical protein DCF19_10520 [Pseudanabaena frigida]